VEASLRMHPHPTPAHYRREAGAPNTNRPLMPHSPQSHLLITLIQRSRLGSPTIPVLNLNGRMQANAPIEP
jgi:hypothetical protein